MSLMKFQNDICENPRVTHPIKIRLLLVFPAFFDLKWVRREMYKKKACCNYFLCKNFHFKNSSEITHCTENLNLLFKTAQQDCHCYVHNIQQHMWGNKKVQPLIQSTFNKFWTMLFTDFSQLKRFKVIISSHAYVLMFYVH